MANIREYNMKGTIILGIDHGYGNIKTAHRIFLTALIKSGKAGRSVERWEAFVWELRSLQRTDLWG